MICVAVLAMAAPCFSQVQTCPTNINFNTGDLSNWSATTGLLSGASASYPAPNSGVTTINEYTISATGIRVITSPGVDPFGGFTTIPTINGYAYNYAIQLGSTANSHDLNSTNRNPGGFTRAITYTINVPSGSAAVPYTMTYAYAMVLENGTHNSNEQPLFKAKLITHDSVITCASPSYYLPTFNNANGGSTGATLDTAAALANGFSNSATPFYSYSGNTGGGNYLYDVWTKGWTEVTFDLSPYRGQQVTLTFESDNCVPGAHFAYAYVALRNTCAGLQISGDSVACINSTTEYSVPALAGATYQWTVPAGWTINSGANSNIINVTVGSNGGSVINHEVNGCADLRDTLPVTTSPPTVAGQVDGSATVCAGINSTVLTVNDEVGSVLKWVYSTDGATWKDTAVTTDTYTAQNLTATTHFAALIQNGKSCSIDTAMAALVNVDPKTVGGDLKPDNINVCQGQNINPTLTLSNYTGSVVNWLLSFDSVRWTGFTPAYTNTSYSTGLVSTSMYYRTIVKSGVCPVDTSAAAALRYFGTQYPAATIDPDTTTICYGKSAILNATINTGTSYAWSNTSVLSGVGDGVVSSHPTSLSVTATPKSTTNIILSVYNAGCPNALNDTFHIGVTAPIIVNAGNDTAVVINEPLQFNATVNNPTANSWSWTPTTDLSASNIPNPIGIYGSNIGASITYVVTAATIAGCIGSDTITVKVYKTNADIFMPNAFSPNGDGKNDVIRPILIGIKQLVFFRVYNRWGQLVFSTTQAGKGWDGTINGSQQSTENFVYMVQAIDYMGKVISKRGNIVLVR